MVARKYINLLSPKRRKNFKAWFEVSKENFSKGLVAGCLYNGKIKESGEKN